MAKQSGKIFITGTIDNLCFYQMEGKFYVRKKSSLTGKRVKKDPAFRVTMQYAGLLGHAAKLASLIYRSLPEADKAKGLYRQVTGKAMQLVKEGYEDEQVLALLQETFTAKNIIKKEEKISIESASDRYGFADAIIASITVASKYNCVETLQASISYSPP